ncbi:hypothetical protein [Krasilnikovia sp. M28-CT-15]|uniref:hypothetical protein n=1 Tax=Krasilnikovia sp. M28-CT-15 TaxID=3373540 RepID=UPI00399D06AA
MKLPEVLDVIEALLIASEHPDIVTVERYGAGSEPWGPTEATSKARTITGVRVRYQSTATASLFGAVQPSERPVPMPDQVPPPDRRAVRLPIFTVQLLDFVRPQPFSSWQLVSFLDVGLEPERGQAPAGVSLVCADGTKMLLRCTSTGPVQGQEPSEEPFPDWVIPEGVKSWQGITATAPPAERR